MYNVYLTRLDISTLGKLHRKGERGRGGGGGGGGK